MTRELPAEFTEGANPIGSPAATAFASAQVAVALLDDQLRYLWAVNQWDAYGAAPARGATDRELYGAAGAALTALKARALATGAPAHGALQLPVAGAEKRYAVTATPQYDAAGALCGLVCVMVEAAPATSPQGACAAPGEDARAEDQLAKLSSDLQRSRDLLRAVFDGIDDGLLLIDPTGTILAVNQPFASLCGARAEELVGGVWLECCTEAFARIPRELVKASLVDGLARIERIRYPQDGDGAHLLDLQTLPLRQSGRPIEQVIVHVRDVTEQVKLETQMIAAERYTANRHLAAVVAHEVNTPLQAIESCLHMAGKLADAEQRGRYLRIAREEIQRVGQILRQLLDLYRPTSATAAPIALNELVERALLLVESSLTRQDIMVVRDFAPSLPLLPGRSDELTQVLLNLIFNAMQAMGRGGQLTVGTGHRQLAGSAWLILTVSDTGPGIAPAVMAHIFEPFFSTKPDGSGLGLAVSQRIVATHGGTLTAQSVPGQGASFCVALPLPGDQGAPAGGSQALGMRPEQNPR